MAGLHGRIRGIRPAEGRRGCSRGAAPIFRIRLVLTPLSQRYRRMVGESSPYHASRRIAASEVNCGTVNLAIPTGRPACSPRLAALRDRSSDPQFSSPSQLDAAPQD